MNAAVKPKKRAVESNLIRRLELCKQYLMLPKAQRKPDDFAAKNGVNTNTFKDWIRKYIRAGLGRCPSATGSTRRGSPL